MRLPSPCVLALQSPLRALLCLCSQRVWHWFSRWFPVFSQERGAPSSNRRRGRAAPEQGLTLSYSLVVSILGRLSRLSSCCCSLSSRPCSCCSCCARCSPCSCCSCCDRCSRLACVACTLSSLSRFPLHDSQVSGRPQNHCKIMYV